MNSKLSLKVFQPERIAPTEQNPEPAPPCGGQWVRDADGGLRPANEATALAAGLKFSTQE